MNTPKIVILGDSLGMPRPNDHIKYEHTYPYLLKQTLRPFEVIPRHVRANDTVRQTNEQNLLDDIIFFEPKIVIIHLGIVDCAPRIFSKKLSKMLTLMPQFLSQTIIKLMSKNRYFITRYFPKTYVTQSEFKKNLKKIAYTIINCRAKPILVEITQTNEINQTRSFNFEKNIRDYNQIIKEIATSLNATIISLNDLQDSILIEDGIHLNKKGHQILADRLVNSIKEVYAEY